MGSSLICLINWEWIVELIRAALGTMKPGGARERTRRNSYKLHQRRFRWNIRRSFFMVSIPGTGCQGSAGVTVPVEISKTSRCGDEGHGLEIVHILILFLFLPWALPAVWVKKPAAAFHLLKPPQSHNCVFLKTQLLPSQKCLICTGFFKIFPFSDQMFCLQSSLSKLLSLKYFPFPTPDHVSLLLNSQHWLISPIKFQPASLSLLSNSVTAPSSWKALSSPVLGMPVSVVINFLLQLPSLKGCSESEMCGRWNYLESPPPFFLGNAWKCLQNTQQKHSKWRLGTISVLACECGLLLPLQPWQPPWSVSAKIILSSSPWWDWGCHSQLFHMHIFLLALCGRVILKSVLAGQRNTRISQSLSPLNQK